MNVTPRAIVIDAERAPVVVVDASALAALPFGEPDAPSIAAALEGHALVAPTLRRYAARRTALTDMLRTYPLLAIDEVQPAADDIARLAEDTSSTAYDAAYFCCSHNSWACPSSRSTVVSPKSRRRSACLAAGKPGGRAISRRLLRVR